MRNLIIIFILMSVATFSQSSTWTLLQKIVASDRAADDDFGRSVAISGNYAIVGAPDEDEDENGSNTFTDAGSAYIYEYDEITDTWSEIQKIVASDRAADDNFGRSVAISGNYAIVGAPDEDEDENGNNTKDFAGSAYIFELDEVNGNWTELQKIVASDREGGDLFGRSVAISGNYAFVGAPSEEEDENGLDSILLAGSAYIFELDEASGTWTEIQKIVARDREFDGEVANFGYSLAITDNYAIIGSYQSSSDENGGDSIKSAGSAYIFELDEASGTWTESQKIVASDRESFDHFGRSVAISGNYAFVGAPNEDEDENGLDSIPLTGSAYIFELDEASGTWTEIQKIVASDRVSLSNFGNSVAIEGSQAIIGSEITNDFELGWGFVGKAYIFELDEASSTWTELQLMDFGEDGFFGDYRGNSVAISGNYAIVGVPGEDEDENGADTLSDAGSAYIFELEIDEPEIYKLTLEATGSESATFYADVADGGATTTVTFEYGLAAGVYSNTIGEQTIDGNSTTVSVGSSTTSLLPNTEYFARARAENSVSFSYSSQSSFNTSPADAESYTFSVTNISFNSASITAELYNGNTISSATVFYGDAENNLDQFLDFTDNPFSASTATFTASQEITGLIPNSVYYYAIVHKNVNNEVTSNTNSFTTLLTNPEIYFTEFINRTSNSSEINFDAYNGNVNSSISFHIGTSSNEYDQLIEFSGNEISASASTLSLTEEITGLNPNEEYFIRIEHFTSFSSVTTTEQSFWTLIEEPLSQSSTFWQSGEELDRIILNFDAFSNITNATGYLILRSNATIGENDLPVDGTAYNVNDTFGNSTVVADITDGNATSHTFTGLSQEKSWQFALVPYNEGADPATTNYKTDNVPTISGFTVPTLGEWGMMVFGGLILIGGVWYIRRMV